LTKLDEQSAAIDVLIVGAGPSGLTLACDLARRGVNFRIVDKIAPYFAGSRGKGLQPRSLEVRHDLGIVDGYIGYLGHRGSALPEYLGKFRRA
jgi:2-polyprenyl-6-methoxyphenol hydroxylase-like FAD-dependent oxidoreductase